MNENRVNEVAKKCKRCWKKRKHVRTQRSLPDGIRREEEE
jgi:hypothetical protein